MGEVELESKKEWVALCQACAYLTVRGIATEGMVTYDKFKELFGMVEDQNETYIIAVAVCRIATATLANETMHEIYVE